MKNWMIRMIRFIMAWTLLVVGRLAEHSEKAPSGLIFLSALIALGLIIVIAIADQGTWES